MTHASGAGAARASRDHGPRRRLGEILVDDGTISPDQLDRALAVQATRRQPLGQTLLQLGFVTDEVMRRALGSQLGVPYLDLDNVIVDRSLARAIDQDFAVEHLVLPVAQIGPTLTVAMDDPTATVVVDELARLTGASIIPVTSSSVAIRRTLRRMYDGSQPTGVDAPIARSPEPQEADAHDTADIEWFRHTLGDPQRSRFAYAGLLGLRLTDFTSLQEAMNEGLPYGAFERLLHNLRLPDDRVIEVLGLSPTTVQARRQARRFPADESDRLLRVAHVCALSLQLFQCDPGLASAWVLSRQPSLSGGAPLTLAATALGAREVEATIRRLRFVAAVEG